MAAYPQAASQEGDSELIVTAVADVLKAMEGQTTSAYLRECGEFGDNKVAADAQLDAPLKGFYTFEQSARSPLFEEQADEDAREIMQADVLAGTKGLADP